jgi:hypothetical protein
VKDTRSTIVCLQETKLQLMDQNVVRRTLGSKFANSYATLLAEQTRGDILLVINEDFFDILDVHLSTHAITATIIIRADRLPWQITVTEPSKL